MLWSYNVAAALEVLSSKASATHVFTYLLALIRQLSKFRDKVHLGLGEADCGERRDDNEQTSEDRRLLVSGIDPPNVAALHDGHQAADEQKHLALFDISSVLAGVLSCLISILQHHTSMRHLEPSKQRQYTLHGGLFEIKA